MTTLSLDDVQRVRERIARAHELANARFREAFASGRGPLPPKAHMAMQAAALLECAQGVRVRGEIRYDEEHRWYVVDPLEEWLDAGAPSAAVRDRVQ